MAPLPPPPLPPQPQPQPKIDGDGRSHQNGTISNIVFTRLHSFALEVSIIGARAVFDVRRKWHSKTMWTSLVLFGLASAFVQIIDRLEYYYSYPTSANLIVQHEDQVKFPQITMCNENQYFRTAAEKYGVADVLREMYPMIRIPSDTQTANLSVFDSWNWTDDTIRFFVKEMAQPLSYAYLFCFYNGVDCAKNAQLKTVMTNMGLCFTFNYAGLNLVASTAGSSYGLSLWLNVLQTDYLVTLNSYTAGFRVLIHDQDEVPWVKELGFKVSPGVCTSVGVTLSQTVQAEPPYGNCKSVKGYTESNCRLQCVSDYVVAKCGCRSDFMSGSAPLCNIVQNYLCVGKAYTNYTSDPDHGSAVCRCAPQCKTNQYDYTISSADFSDLSMNSIVKSASSFMPDMSSDYISKNLACLEVYFSTLNTVTIKTDAAYSFIALLSDIGGALGLLLGATLLTVVEIAEFMIGLTREFIGQYRKARNQQKSVEMDGHQNDVAKERLPEQTSFEDDIKHRVLSVISLNEPI